MRRRRVLSILLVVASSIAAVTCVRSQTVDCSDGSVCPPGTRCHQIENLGISVCAAERPFCGDGRIDLVLGEQCDEGGALSGDGCSSLCSNEFSVWRDVQTFPQTTSGRISYSLVTDPLGGVLMLGGSVGSAAPSANQHADLADVWRWDRSWFRLADLPEPRADYAIAYDPRRNRVVLFGGVDQDGGLFGDTLEWDGYVWETVTVPGPPARRGAGFTCDASRCILFGGKDASGLLGDVWFWDGVNWIVDTVSPRPMARQRPMMTFDENRGVVVLFGGVGSGDLPVRETWELSGSQWNEIAAPPPPTGPPGGAVVTGAFDSARNSVLMLTDPSAGQLQVWSYDGAWTPVVVPAVSSSYGSLARSTDDTLILGRAFIASSDLQEWRRPPALGFLAVPNTLPFNGESAAYDRRRGRTVVNSHFQLKTFEWNGVGWVRGSDVPGPGLFATNAPLAYDEACGDMILFGGLGTDGSTRFTATQRYSGTWQDLMLPGPSARSGHAFTYDATRGVFVMFGGERIVGQDVVPFDEVWELGGACDARVWTQAMPEGTGPTARVRSRLVYDPVRGVSVLFGGVDATGERDDTWEWDGVRWTERTTTIQPSRRADHAMTFDPLRGRIVLNGGRRGANTIFSDTWEWDGSAWTEVEPVLVPAGRFSHALAPDVTGGLVAVGGFLDATGTLLVRLRYETPDANRETCVDGVDADGDGLFGCDDPDCRLRCAPLCSFETPFAECQGPRCGDGEQSPLEDYLLCPADAPRP